ncbi:MAG: hypothetical protein GQ526_05450 [Ardenticatenales bacterium]|nr:hypothetical protein [Ardenticatenales bacterium]
MRLSATTGSESAAPLAVGAFRPVSLRAGPGAARMSRLGLVAAPVDEVAHSQAHTAVGAWRMAEEAVASWVYLVYDWGFPPETGREGWRDFGLAVQDYHASGVRVFGRVETSNCIPADSYRGRDWYAVDPRGRPVHYDAGRWMTCWSHPDWLAHLREMVRGIAAAGAAGVFFHNPWHGIQPIHLQGAWTGPAGCYCPRCRIAFQEETGLEIPARINPRTGGAGRRYLMWRAAQVTDTLARLADYARSLGAGLMVSTNDSWPAAWPSFLAYGIDLARLARAQDVMMIEDCCLPQYDVGEGGAPTLVNNALALRTARGLVGAKPLSVSAGGRGDVLGDVYPDRRVRQGIAEAAACGAAMVVVGSGVVEDGVLSLLTADKFAPRREAVGLIHRWLAENEDLYSDRQNAAAVGLLYPDEALWWAWDRVAPAYWGAGQTLLAAGIPWRVVTREDDLSDLEVLLCFERLAAGDVSLTGRLIVVPELPGWEFPRSSWLARSGAARAAVSGGAGWLVRQRLHRRWARQLAKRLGLTRLRQSPFFRLPTASARGRLMEALAEVPFPRLVAEVPVLAELWRKGEMRQLHLVNYGADPVTVRVEFGRRVSGWLLSPDRPMRSEIGPAAGLDVSLDVYTVIQFRETG